MANANGNRQLWNSNSFPNKGSCSGIQFSTRTDGNTIQSHWCKRQPISWVHFLRTCWRYFYQFIDYFFFFFYKLPLFYNSIYYIVEIVCDPPLIADKYLFYQCPDGYTYGSTCQLKCMGSFPLIGNETITCERNDSFTPPRGYWDMGELQPYCSSKPHSFFPLLDFYRLKICIFYFINYQCCFEIFQKTLAIRFWRPKMEPCHAQRGCLGCSVRCNVLVNMISRMEQWAQMELLSLANLPALNHWENTLHQIQFLDVHVCNFYV